METPTKPKQTPSPSSIMVGGAPKRAKDMDWIQNLFQGSFCDPFQGGEKVTDQQDNDDGDDDGDESTAVDSTTSSSDGPLSFRRGMSVKKSPKTKMDSRSIPMNTSESDLSAIDDCSNSGSNAGVRGLIQKFEGDSKESSSKASSSSKANTGSTKKWMAVLFMVLVVMTASIVFVQTAGYHDIDERCHMDNIQTELIKHKEMLVMETKKRFGKSIGDDIVVPPPAPKKKKGIFRLFQKKANKA